MDYQFFNSMITGFSNNNLQKNLILEPLCCIIKIALIQFKENGTKISVIDNSIQFNEPSIAQGILRSINGDCREDLHNIYHPLLKCIEWFPLKEHKLLYQECKKGLEILNSVYDNNTTIHHTITHYISIINEDNKIELPETNPIIDQLKNIWSQDEIKAIQELLDLIIKNKNREIYINALNDIVSAKEKIVYEYIKKVSTSY